MFIFNLSKPNPLILAFRPRAIKISSKTAEPFVLGSDQVLEFQGEIYGKLKTKDELIELYSKMQGTPHTLWTANVIAQAGRPLWRYVGRSDLTLRPLSDSEIQEYIDTYWDDIQYCAGGYQIEKTPSLFSKVTGHWFDILGL